MTVLEERKRLVKLKIEKNILNNFFEHKGTSLSMTSPSGPSKKLFT